MSRLYRDTGRSLSNPVPHSSLSPSSIPPSSGVALPIFGQKLIPRDYLGTRSKTSPETTSSPQYSVSNTFFSIDPFQRDRTTGGNVARIAQDNTGIYDVSPTSALFPDSLTRRNNELKIPKIRSPTSADFPSSITKARSKSSVAPSMLDAEALNRLIMPRTSSIDSAISTVSAHSINRAAGDVRDPSPTSVRNLIAAAGSAEALIAHLLKDKHSVASQNAQLWKLVEKQRALVLGLNKDVERIAKERDKFKDRVKELELHTIPEGGQSHQPTGYAPRTFQASATTTTGSLHQTRNHAVNHNNSGRTLIEQIPLQDKISAPTREGQDVRGKETTPVAQAPNPILPEVHNARPTQSSAFRIQPKLEIPDGGPPTFNVIEATPLSEKPIKTLPSTRKAPPKPLNLGQSKEDEAINNRTTAKSDSDEESGRGRRRTREEDDRDREMSAVKAEAEARSRSKKNKAPKLVTKEEKQTPSQIQVPAPPPTPGLPLSPRPQHAQTVAAPSTHLSAVNVQQPTSLNDRLLATSLKSPGLPQSPRPSNRNEGSIVNSSLPVSPRVNMGAFPLSPRAPKTALPVPTNLSAPTDAAALQNTQSRSQQPTPLTTAFSPVDRLQAYQSSGPDPPMVYRGLAVSAYPNLLLPPNALPFIRVQVQSSRLRPSRYSVLGLKNQDEATVFSLSVISRSSNSELWRIEKFPGSLPQLELQLKLRCADLPRMPDRKLFIGQSPATLDERRNAIDKYFEDLLDTHIDEVAAIAICRFLSTDVIDPEQTKSTPSGGTDGATQSSVPGQPTIKTGYLTKKGKNFGGWKSRFFILDGSDFRYYESAGGPHSGTIRLKNALIGKQKDNDTIDDADGQYRHAFLIQEPKRKDSGNYTRHVLCAESDAERDEWVKQILQWVEGDVTSRSGSRSEQSTSASTSQEFNDLDNRYQSSKAGPSSRDTRDTHPNTPTPTSGSSIDSSILDNMVPVKSANISGPMNGGIITDSSVWGYRSTSNTTTKEPKDKTHKMSNIFGFKKPDSLVVQQEPKPPKPRILRHNGYVRPVFGLPLTEAVEFCSPFNVEVNLPAVVYRSIEYLRHMNAASEEGLFRLSGSNVVVRNLKERFNTEGDIDLISEDDYHDVHAVASLFKTYLRELPSTLLTRELHIEFIKVLEIESHSDKVAAYNMLVHMLPPANLSLLKEMAKYLLEVTENADKNKMSVRNVGIVFSPTLNIPTPVFTLLLTEYKAIFEQESSPTSEIRSTEITTPVALTPDEIRSPRHQMFSDLPTPAYNQSTFAGQAAMVPQRGTMTGTGELGFMPVNPAYEANGFPAAYRSATAPAANTMTQAQDAGGFSSLNGLLAPNNAPTERAKKRQSMMITPG